MIRPEIVQSNTTQLVSCHRHELAKAAGRDTNPGEEDGRDGGVEEIAWVHRLYRDTQAEIREPERVSMRRRISMVRHTSTRRGGRGDAWSTPELIRSNHIKHLPRSVPD